MQQKFLSILMVVFLGFDSFSQSEKQVDSLNAVLKSTKNDSIKIEVIYKLSNYYMMVDINKAINMNKKSFLLSKGKFLEFGLAKSYNIKGILHDIKGEIDSAYFCYKQAVLFSTKTKLYSTQASALNNIGLLEWNKSNYLKAIQYYDRALRVFEKIGNKSGMANTKSNIGMLYSALGDRENEKKHLEESLKIRLEIKDVYGISVSYVNLGRYYEAQGDKKTAISFYEKAIRYKRQIDDQRGIAITNNNLASLLIYSKKYDSALVYLKESVAIAQKLGAKQVLAYAYFGLTEIHIARKQIVEAKETIAVAKRNLVDLEDNSGMITYLRSEESIAILEKNYKKAYGFAKEKSKLENKLKGLEIKKSISEIEAKYESEKKEKELATEKVKVSVRESKIRQKNNLLYSILIVFVAFLLISYLLFNQQKLKNRQLKKENELKDAMAEIETQNHLQEQRLHISRDLHDNIGAQLTFIISSLDNLKYMELPKEKRNKKINFISEFTTATIYELRDTIWAMNKNDITFDDLKARITNFIDNAKSSKDTIHFEFEIDGNLDLEQTFTSVEGMNMYRIIQESVNNALKHAKAENIKVVISQCNSDLIIKVVDDGEGFELINDEIGNGINNMHKRAKELGAVIEIISTKDRGTTIVLRKPLR